MQAMRYGHQESGRSSGASLTQEQEKMVKKVMLTMKDFDIQRGQQDCEATLRETNFDFDKAIDLLISPNYHPWISNPINKSLHRPSGHGGPNPRRREYNDRRPNRNEHKRQQTAKHTGPTNGEGSTKAASHEVTPEKHRTTSDSTHKGEDNADNKRVLQITSKSPALKENAGPSDAGPTNNSKESATSSKPKTHTSKKEKHDAAPDKSEPATPPGAPVKVVINTQKTAEKAAIAQGADSVSKPELTATSASQKITIKITSTKTTKDSTSPSSVVQKPHDGQKDNIQLMLKPSGGQQAPPIDVMALEKNLGRPTENTPQMAMVQQPGQQPYVMASNIPVMSAPIASAQPNQQPVQVVYVPVYYPSQGPIGEMNPFPPTTSSQVKGTDMFQIPGYQMVHMPMPMMNGMQGQVLAPMQMSPGQQTPHFAFPFVGEAQSQSK
ncbi:Hypothetical protein DHA2_153231 [Giardia duodenalis]|uniref:UBA domain-containing protein n=1 Tax=Giardia intestinalis TaxID=5741 RepID=V6TAV6_GIAIN|nr:Hypothetical protein DHA2_153231 [Giardia intestinalis]